jgi:hypothetical protein
MTQTIGSLFDPSKDIHRKIEKVVQYDARNPERLKAEISEYIATESIQQQLEKLVDDMDTAMGAGPGSEIGVWVSGFYGSGKSSFTKYLGFALDDSIVVDGVPFREHFLNRITDAKIRPRVNTVIKKYPAAVIMVDLSTEMLAGPSLEHIADVLYFKVLRWAGYSRNLKIAALQRKAEKDNRETEFKMRVQDAFNGTLTWEQLQEDAFVMDALVPRIAHEMYPQLFPTEVSFSTNDDFIIESARDRVIEMLEIARKKSGKELVVFIVDEAGQYVAPRLELILGLQGLAQSLKEIGGGKAWLFATAQQTLTEDDKRAAVNSAELFRLNARFPIPVHLESSDIKEICYRRLLGKSAQGKQELERLFEKHGQELKHNTKLQDAKYYETDFSKEWFVNLYPFLPAHFEILLQLLAQLAKSTGGIGLRSAIKVIQDILIESENGEQPVADRPVGWLATTVTLYDALEKDIRRAERSVHDAVGKTLILYPDSTLHSDVAKTIAILQILKNMPVTRDNVASLMHPSISSPSRAEDVRRAIDEMVKNPLAPLGEEDGSLKFLSEKVRDIEKQRGELVVRQIEVRRHFNEALRTVFNHVPHTTVAGGVTAGLKAQTPLGPVSLLNERNPIQIMIELVESAQYDASRRRLVTESTTKIGQNVIYLLSRGSADAEAHAQEIFRSEQIAELCRLDPDREVRSYRQGQLDAKERYADQLRATLRNALSSGTFVFRGAQHPVGELDLDHNIDLAAGKILKIAAERIYDHYDEAPIRVETNAAEKFLKLDTVSAATAATDPLGLVEMAAQQRRIKSDHKAIVSIRDFLNEQGSVDGKRLLEKFSDAPYNWSPDTVRYILAAMLTGGELSMNVSGSTVTAPEQKATEALKTNKSFGNVGVSLRSDKPSNEMLANAAKRLTGLSGENVFPLEPDIAKAAQRLFQKSQIALGTLSEKLASLGVGGAARAHALVTQLSDALLTDASDAPQRLGGSESKLYEDLRWARELKTKLDQGLATTIRELAQHCKTIAELPSAGVPGELKSGAIGERQLVEERLQGDDFHHHIADLNTAFTSIRIQVATAVQQLSAQQHTRIENAIAGLHTIPEWKELTQEQQANVIGDLEKNHLDAPAELGGLQQLMNHEYTIQNAIATARESVIATGESVRQKRREEELQTMRDKQRVSRSIEIPRVVRTEDELAQLIAALQQLREEFSLYSELELKIARDPSS